MPHSVWTHRIWSEECVFEREDIFAKGLDLSTYFRSIFGDFCGGGELFYCSESFPVPFGTVVDFRKVFVHVILKIWNRRIEMYTLLPETKDKMSEVIDELKGGKLSGIMFINCLSEWQKTLWCPVNPIRKGSRSGWAAIREIGVFVRCWFRASKRDSKKN